MGETNNATDGTNVLFPVLIFLPILSLILLRHHLKSSKTALPPGPRPWPIFGNLLHVGRKPHVTLANFTKSYGPLMSLRLGTQLVIVGSSAAAAEQILKTHDRVLSGRYVPHAVPVKNPEINRFSLGWAQECSDGWRQFRTLCRTHLFSSKAIESQAGVRERKVTEMVRFLSSMEGKEVRIGEIAFATVFNMLGNILMSRDFVGLEKEGVDGEIMGLVRNYMDLFSSPNVSDFYPILGALDLQGLKKRATQVYAKICAAWAPIMDERRQSKKGDGWSQNDDLLDILINNSSSNDQANHMLLEVIAAGADATTSTVEWAMAELVRSPKCIERVCDELAREVKQGPLKESHLPQLPYLQACVKETLRLHPSAPFLIPHRALETCKVMNYTIPKNSQVLVNVWAIARDPMIWKDPLEFKPERFLNSTLDFKGIDFEFLPFGAGRRICPGQPMAAKQVPLILGSLLHSVSWSLPHGTHDPTLINMNEKSGVTLHKEQPLILIPKVKA